MDDEKQKAYAIMARLNFSEQQLVQVTALECAVRALISSHPNPQAVRMLFDQVYALIAVSPPFIGNKDLLAAHRSVAEALFKPPAERET